MPAWQFVGVSQGLNVPRQPVLLTTLITKTAATGAWDAGASSVETIAGDGFIEWTVSEVNKYRQCGLSRIDANVNYTSILFSFSCNAATAALEIFESGVQKYAGGAASVAIGDVLRIERRGGTINYYKNGAWVYGSLDANQAGGLRVDASFFDQNATVAGVRMYDATLRAWKSLTWTNVTGASVAQGVALQRRRVMVASTAKQLAGDQLVVVLAQQGGGFASFVESTNVTWQFVDVVSAADHRTFLVYRRRALDGDPASYSFDISETQETVGAMLVYRNTDDSAALVSSICDDIFGGTIWPCAKRTTTRVTDVFLGLVMQKTKTGTMTVQSDCTLRVDYFPPTTFGFATPRLLAFDFAPEIVGVTDAKRVTASVASDGAAATCLLAGVNPPGHGLSWLPVAPGAIGLPSDGI